MEEIVIDPEYLHVSLEPGAVFSRITPGDCTVFAYVIQGETSIDSRQVVNGQLALFTPGGGVEIKGTDFGAQFLYISGKPLKEPVAWRGPIVMNTQGELDIAFQEYQDGTFIK